MFSISNLSEISSGGVWGGVTGIVGTFWKLNVQKKHSFTTPLNWHPHGKRQTWCCLDSTWIDLFQELWVSLELISPTNSPRAEKALPHQAGVLEVPGSASSDCLIDITVPLCRGRGKRTKRKKRRYWKLEKVWFLHKAAALCWTPWKGNSWQYPLPIAAGVGTISHSGHC